MPVTCYESDHPVPRLEPFRQKFAQPPRGRTLPAALPAIGKAPAPPSDKNRTATTKTPAPPFARRTHVRITPFTAAVVPFTAAVVPFTTAVVPFTAAVVPITATVVPFTAVVVPFTATVVPFTTAVVPLTTAILPLSETTTRRKRFENRLHSGSTSREKTRTRAQIGFRTNNVLLPLSAPTICRELTRKGRQDMDQANSNNENEAEARVAAARQKQAAADREAEQAAMRVRKELAFAGEIDPQRLARIKHLVERGSWDEERRLHESLRTQLASSEVDSARRLTEIRLREAAARQSTRFDDEMRRYLMLKERNAHSDFQSRHI